MRKASKALALLLAFLMVVSAMPMSVFAEAAGSASSFDLVVDDDGNDADVTYPDDMGEAPTGADLYDGVTPTGIKLDWDAWQTIFPEDDMTSNQDIGFTLWRETATEAVVPSDELDDVTYADKEKISIISDDSVVKVLNVYPIPASEGLLKEWLTLAYEGSGEAYTKHFSVDTVLLDAEAALHAGQSAPEKTFNADYAEILANGDYDVIFFGTSDGNGDLTSVAEGYTRKFYDLSKGAYEAVDAFIKEGNGVLFGHDTVCSADHLDGDSSDGDGFDYFTQFADELGIVCLEGEAQQEVVSQKGNEPTPNVKVVNNGLLTSYPFTISEELVVPETHSLLQKVPAGSAATVWMQLQDADGDGKYHLGEEFSAYLLTNNNVAMIQTGHSSNNVNITESAHKQEGQVIANTLFYLMQKSIGDYSTDGDFVDKVAPVIDEDATAAITDLTPTDGRQPQYFNADVEISASDLGTAYKYYVEATREKKVVVTSNEAEALAISNLKGYMIEINESEAKIGADKMAAERKDGNDTTNRAIVVDVVAAGAPLSENVAINTGDMPGGESGLQVVPGKSYYVHIVPVDNANNYGNEIVVEISFDELYDPNVDTEIEAVPNQPVDEETGEPANDNAYTDSEGDAVYYPGNYEDINGDEFPERQTDDEVQISVSAKVDTGSKDVVGVITLVKWEVDQDGNIVTDENGDPVVDRIYTADNLDELADLDEKIEYGNEYTKDIVFDIDKIYLDDSDYDTNGEYTVTIEWFEKEDDGSLSEEPVAVDETDFTIVRPDCKVTFNYKDVNNKGEIVDKSVTKIVKYGDEAKAPSVKPSVKDSQWVYVAKDWKLISGGDAMNKITDDSVFEMQYNKHALGTAPEQPEIPEQPVVPDEPKEEIDFIRLGGETRIETAIEISKHGWKNGAKVVILATANQFPDAMAGVPLAKAVDAPILLTVNGEKLEDVVKAEIARLSPEKVYILGQTDAVNANIEKELKAIYEVERVGGKDRFGTAAQIAYEMEEVYGEKADAVYFVRSDLFPDALSVSSVAAIEHNPILYVAPSGKLDVDTIKYADTIGAEATIVGGPEAVNAVGESNIKTLFKSVDRVYGKDRYATSVAICTAKDSLFTGKATALATGKKFPDALTGGSFAAKNNIPVLLVNGNVSPELAQYLSNRPINTLYVFGGQLAVSDQVAYQALGYCVAYTE